MTQQTSLQLYNSLAREKQLFEPVHPGRVHMYVCGPTVYNDAHLGHGKTYINFDTIVRYFRYLGYRVLYVQNITDVGHLLDGGEDRILKGAAREQVQPMELAERYTRRYYRDMDRLNVLRPDIAPRATGHVIEMITLIERLIASGHAYEANGSVYFAVESFPEYGKLSGRRVEELQSGYREAVRDEKRHSADFALWKRADPEHIMRWPSPWGEGFPGWHIECSAMATKYLGQPIDIHGGGVENKFPHHECEIAQSEAATDKPFARYWLHNGMLMIRGEEMHKSLGNFVTLDQAFERWDPMVIRLFVLLSHYRGPLDLTEEAVDAAEKGLERLYNAIRALRRRRASAPEGEVDPEVASLLNETQKRFEAAMNDDINTPGAVAALYDMTREVNARLTSEAPLSAASLESIDALYKELAGNVLGLLGESLERDATAGMTADLLDLLVTTRTRLREARQYDLADGIRDQLSALGVDLRDDVEGTRWVVR